jgi:hypothetical protein
MRWQGMRKSDNVEDRRGIGGKQIAVGGGLGGIVIVVLFLLFGGNSDEVLQTLQTSGTSSPSAAGQPLTDKEKEMGDFVSVPQSAQKRDVSGLDKWHLGHMTAIPDPFNKEIFSLTLPGGRSIYRARPATL